MVLASLGLNMTFPTCGLLAVFFLLSDQITTGIGGAGVWASTPAPRLSNLKIYVY